MRDEALESEGCRMFAQSMVEYGALASARTTLLTLAYGFRDWLAQISPATWAVVGGLVIAVVLMRGRRRR
jgi:hypothetical protein